MGDAASAPSHGPAPVPAPLAWFECRAGAAGDMLLGALLDAGAALDAVQGAVDALGVGPIRLAVRSVRRHGIAATKLDVRVEDPAEPVTRTWRDVRRLIERADLAEPVRARALDVFARLARAEATVHRVRPDEVRFHEVGALDAIADVVGCCMALHLLGIREAMCSPVALGHGATSGEHGLVPVPGPAVLELLQEAHTPVYGGDVRAELCTPTGAALLAATVDRWGELPPMRITATGTGAGDRELSAVPNIVRVVLGTPVGTWAGTWAGTGAGTPAGQSAGTSAAAGEPVVRDQLLIEANVDDLDPRLWPSALARLLGAGAADAWLTPIIMKKGRPAHTVAVLCDAEDADAVRRVLYTETSTIGLRELVVGKRELARSQRTVSVDGCEVRIKVAYLDDVLVNAQPEYEDVSAAATALGRPEKFVLAAAVAALHASADPAHPGHSRPGPDGGGGAST